MTPVSHGRSGRPWRRLREQVLKRDPFCMIRGPKCRGLSTTVDHIVPLSVAPELAHSLSNLRGACGPCNYAGGARITNRQHPKGAPTCSPRNLPCTSDGVGPWCYFTCGGSLAPFSCRARVASDGGLG